MGALEWGLYGYAKGVLDNWLTYFIKDDGFVLYRGLEMAEHGRMLSNIAQYYQYTGDGDLLLKHLDKIKGIGWLLNQRRDAALRNYPPTDSRHGMPTGNDEADLFWQTVSLGPKGNRTEMPFISIAAEMWRGMRDIGAALEAVGKAKGSAAATAIGNNFSAVAPPLLATLRKSMAMDAFSSSGGAGPRCFPYVAGNKNCGELKPQPSDRDSEPWRTYVSSGTCNFYFYIPYESVS